MGIPLIVNTSSGIGVQDHRNHCSGSRNPRSRSRNRCSRWIGISVQDGPEYAIERANHVWCGDITYIPVRRGFLYLVAIMDWASRYVLAWRLSNTLDASFCVEALEETLTRHGQPEIFNTDQGSQFTGFAFTGRLRAAGVQISMDGRGRCMDNIFIERLWRSLKYEAVYLHDLADGFQARRVIGEWIDFYNAERPHSALGGKTPAEAYRGDPPADMMDKPLRALPTYPQAQQRRQEDRSKDILAR